MFAFAAHSSCICRLQSYSPYILSLSIKYTQSTYRGLFASVFQFPQQSNENDKCNRPENTSIFTSGVIIRAYNRSDTVKRDDPYTVNAELRPLILSQL